jgi:hypothetical protein
MKTSTFFFVAIFLFALLPTTPASALAIGQQDTFEDGTTQGWLTGLLGAPTPFPPENFPTGGPDGAGDAYLQLTSSGTQLSGGRMTAINVSQWTGDYIAAGIGAIRMDLINLGNTDLSLRLLFANPQAAPPTALAISTDAFLLPAGSGWTTVYFSIAPEDLTALLGSPVAALPGATEFRLFHSPTPNFPPDPAAAQLGVDNILARADAVVPEPASALLFGAALCSWLGLRKRQSR